MTTTATDLARTSLELVKAGRRDEWIDLFDDDAFIEDPVGPSPLDPEGRGHRGRAAIAQFYDLGIGGIKNFDYEITRTCRCGDEVAVMVTFRITAQNDELLEFDAFNIYQRAANGKLAALRSFHHGAED